MKNWWMVLWTTIIDMWNIFCSLNFTNLHLCPHYRHCYRQEPHPNRTASSSSSSFWLMPIHQKSVKVSNKMWKNQLQSKFAAFWVQQRWHKTIYILMRPHYNMHVRIKYRSACFFEVMFERNLLKLIIQYHHSMVKLPAKKIRLAFVVCELSIAERTDNCVVWIAIVWL